VFQLGEIRPLTKQTARLRHFGPFADRRQSTLNGERGQPGCSGEEFTTPTGAKRPKLFVRKINSEARGANRGLLQQNPPNSDVPTNSIDDRQHHHFGMNSRCFIRSASPRIFCAGEINQPTFLCDRLDMG
jgi:hypothetical protein